MLASTHGVFVYHPSPIDLLALDAYGPRAALPATNGDWTSVTVPPGSGTAACLGECSSPRTSTCSPSAPGSAWLARPLIVGDQRLAAAARPRDRGAARAVPGIALRELPRRRRWPDGAQSSSPAARASSARTSSRALLERGDDVRVLDNFSTGNRANLDGLDVEVVEGELRSYERVHNAVRGIEVVYHLGALGSVPRSVQDPLTSSAVNVEGTLNVLLAARDEGVRRVVFSSSSSVYGIEPPAPDDRGRCRPTRSRRTASPSSPPSATASASPRLRDVRDASSLRYFNVFGPRQSPFSQYAAVVPLFITAIASGRADDDLRRRRAVARLHVRRATSSTRRCSPRATPTARAAGSSTSPPARRPA